jgi:WD40 repeat protein
MRTRGWLCLVLALALIELGSVAETHARAIDEPPRLVVQMGHGHGVTSFAFSQDGKTLVTGSKDRTLKLWNVATGRELRTLVGHMESVTSVAFSPDGKTVVSGSEDHTLRLWDVVTGRELRAFNGHTSHVTSVEFSFDGKRLVSGSWDRTLKLWDVATGQVVRTFTGHSESVSSVALSSDGQTLASGSEDNTLMLWDVESGRKLRALSGHVQALTSVSFSPDGKTLASGSEDKTVKLWDVVSGRELRSLMGHTEAVISVEFSPDGKTLVSGGDDLTMVIWAAASGRKLRTIEGEFLEESYMSLGLFAFSRDGNTLISAGGSRMALWDVASGRAIRTISGSRAHVRSVAFSPDGKTLALGSRDRTVKFWSVVGDREPRTFAGHTAWVTSVAFSTDGRIVVSGSNDHSLKLWDATTGRELHALVGHQGWVLSVAFSPTGRTVASGSMDDTVKLWDADSGRELRTLRGHKGDVAGVAFSPDGRTVGSSSWDHTVKLWDVATGRELHTLPVGATLTSIAFSPDGKAIALGDWENRITLWDVASAKAVRTFKGHEDKVNSVAFTPDSKTLVTGSQDNVLKLWDVASGRELRTLVGHGNDVTGVAVSPDGETVASGSDDETVKLWRVADGALLATLIYFSDGRWAVTDSEGRFDVADLEDTPHLHWVMPDDPLTPLPLELFMRDYYEPRLLPRIMNGEKFTPVRALTDLNRVQPEVRIASVEANPEQSGYVNVTVEAAGARRSYASGGALSTTAVHDLRLFRNGQLVGYAAGRLAEADGNPFRDTFPVRLPRGEEPLQFTAYAFNDDRVKSATVQQTYIPANATVAGKPLAYIITVGVNHHDNPAWDLRYAANDARQIGQNLATRLSGQGNYEAIVTIPLISEAAGARLGTKANLKAVLDVLAGRSADVSAIPLGRQLRQATPDDLVLISFSGHGYGEGGSFYLIPGDTGAGVGRAITPELTARAISSDELSTWLREVDAGDLVLVVDACHSAATVGEQFKPGPMGSRGLGQLAFDKGMRILAASQADDVALESDLIKQGLLSFALVQDGLVERRADHHPIDEKIMLEEWLRYGVSRVPSLAEEVEAGSLAPAPGASEGRGEVITFAGESMTKRVIQQPALFDFTKGRRDVVLEGQMK